MLGDLISKALGVTGVTPDAVERWLGVPCGCVERQERLNQLGYWAARVVGGKVAKAKEYLDVIIRG